MSPAAGGRSYGIADYCEASSTAKIDVRGSYFRVEGENRYRLVSAQSRITAPYELGAGANPPVLATNWSLKGMDSFFETDCDDTVCNATPSPDAETHLLTFDPAYTGTGPDHGPWFDTQLAKCRGP